MKLLTCEYQGRRFAAASDGEFIVAQLSRQKSKIFIMN